jgi:hypothetical protein
MLGHANVEQTSGYLSATLSGLHQSMKALDRKRRAAGRKAPSAAACNPLANTLDDDDGRQ